MVSRIRGCSLSLALFVLLGAGAVDAQTVVSAQARDGRVYVDFAADQTAVRQIDSRLSGPSPMSLTWVVEVRRISRHWRDRPLAHATVQMFVRHAQEDRFEVTRRHNGEQITQVVDRDTLYAVLSAFRVPLFRLTEMPPGPYRVSVRGTVEGGGEAPVLTPVLASADVEGTH